MTITTNTSKSSRWVADGYNRIWTYPFKALAATDLTLLVTNPAGFETEIKNGFTVNGLGNDGGGTVVYPVDPAPPLAAGSTVVVRRTTPRTQPYKVGSQGRFFPETHEKALDNLEAQIQELGLQIDRAVRTPLSDTNPMKPLPVQAARANKLFAFDVNGDPSTANVSVGDIIAARDAAAQSALDAEIDRQATQDYLGAQQKVYLGARSTPPTLNWDGTPLITGSEYFSTTDSTRYTWTGTTWIAAGAASIPGNYVDNARLTDMATQTIKGRNTAGTGDPEDLPITTVRTMIGAFVPGRPGLAPDPVTGDAARFLRSDGTWASPPQSVVAAYLRVNGGAQQDSFLQLVRDGGTYMMANGAPKIIPSGAGIQMHAGAWGLSVNADYYIGVADLNNDGILDSLAPFWVGNSSYANDPTTSLPVIVQDTRYALVGRVRVGSYVGQPYFIDTPAQRWTASYYNPRPKEIIAMSTATITTATVNPSWAVMPDLSVSMVTFDDAPVDVSFTGSLDNPNNTTTAGTGRVTWLIDGGANASFGLVSVGLASQVSSGVVPAALRAVVPLAEGYHSFGLAWQNLQSGLTMRRVYNSAITGVVWG